ncbi:S8 family serine peptidase [Halorussus sp. MSC15.2]|uniref:S8 family peptidase n=1 Tax=Halorussus sp. MSC15.2 TaxID=2283638 RepID=UPI0013D24EFC|nr:S8 family serine peptidase [Halorussus sp. MSC15.2]NEU56498.1 S8 family peptidase [Halorussus sp. MSC15.2]
MSDHSRRTFLKAAGSAVGSAALVSGPVSASGSGTRNTRFLVDLQEVSRSEVPEDVEIIHDISEIDLLAARGDPDVVPGEASTTPDVTVYRDDQTYDGGPAKEHDANGEGSKGPAWDSGEPTNTELQWDKRKQRVGDLTENPGNGRTVQDTTKGEGSRVAVVDSGVYDGHPDLADVVNAELSANYTTDDYDFRPNGAGDHGTHVAGIVAGTNANGEGVLGTAPETEIVAHRVFSGVPGEGASTGDTIAALTDAATKGCDAANFSVGYPPANPNEDWVADVKEAYSRLAEYARSQDMIIVNSAGNAGVDMTPDDVISLPTEVEGIFGVSATGPIGYLWDDKKASREDKGLKKLEKPTTQPAKYTNYGEGVDVSAEGGNYDLDAYQKGVEGWFYDLVYSSVVEHDADGEPTPGYGWKAGTSMAAPQVTGAVALARSLRPDISAEELKSLIKETATDAPGGELYHGAGHLDLRRLVKRLR